jgi:hypothetical protein
MEWREKLSEIECHFGHHEKRDWKPAIEMACDFVKKYPDNMEIYIRVIYLIHNILVEEIYPDSEHDKMANLLKEFFDKSYSLFSENAEYLFFTGIILHIAEWYFGFEDTIFAVDMQKKAMDKERGNILYEWSYRLSAGDIVCGYLASQLIKYDNETVIWLKSKGFPGTYVLECLKMSNKEYLEQKNHE